ncbi:helix-turn-helix domain-containing protein [Mangrovimonas sp. YM274]|uniref:AraC family transcriptional regulator n=1 Tax=Mangrovimonas sp. YM274 TaxID=3070660 RepID=UPI0027DCE971|nr:helix-turn-helix domain-containing protein [Mangrovimonas sp. YM274]WMI68428.1 helix-turn-helix domain-containing protein [Mangrovimonas sp. YM274]
MDLIAVINFLLIAGVIQGFVFNLVTLFFKKKFNKVVVYLNLTVFFISLNNLQAWLGENGFSSNNFLIKELLVPWYVFILPVFYAFLLHFLQVRNQFRSYIKFTVILFSVEVIVRLCLISYVYYHVEGRDNHLILVYTSCEEILNLLFTSFIFYKSWTLVFSKQDKYKDFLTYDDIAWVKIFLKLGVFIMVLWIISIGIYVLVYKINGNEEAYYPLRLGTSILLYWIGYQGFYRYNVVQDRIFLRRSIAKRNDELQLYSLLEPNPELMEKYLAEFQTINEYIVDNQRYLDPQLNMNILAQEMNISTSHFSKLINTFSGYSFPDYINTLRIEQSKKLLADESFNQYTIVAIGLECGFNSRSTFYSAFKKFTSLTPTQYREKFT